jgi:hypothetical protein
MTAALITLAALVAELAAVGLVWHAGGRYSDWRARRSTPRSLRLEKP